jgi:hypothetical protein
MLAEVKKFTAQLLVAVSEKVSSQKQVMRRENILQINLISTPQILGL